MSVSLKTEHLKRYKDIVRLLLKHGSSQAWKDAAASDAAASNAGGTTLNEDDMKHSDLAAEGEAFATDLEKMGPTFIKLGQLLSTRIDLLPAPFLESLSRLQDQVDPFPFEEVQQIISVELGLRLSKAFDDFDPEPLAAASLGQVHQARMRDGRRVAVKVQRPGIRKQILDDLDALFEGAALIDDHTEVGNRYRFKEIVEEFRKTMLRELDYRREANNLILIKENLKDFAKIVVPSPIEDYTTSKVLTMEFISGKKITSLGPLAKMELNGEELAEELFKAYLKQILVDGIFHADPHPGNVFITDDGRLALLDLGMIGHVPKRLQENLLQLVLAISEGRAEDAADQAFKIGSKTSRFDELLFRKHVIDIVFEHQNVELKEIQVGQVVLKLARVSADTGLRMPSEITLLGKTLLNLDQVGRTLDPEFNPNEAIRSHAAEILSRKMVQSLSPGNIFSAALEMKDFTERLPGRINRILDAVAGNHLKVRVNAINEKRLLEGFQKIANRITMGLIIASLIIGAAMMMRIETSFRILGYPALAIIFFIAAACGGLVLIFNIIWHDTQSGKKKRQQS